MKYEITDICKQTAFGEVFRIRALKDFSDVKAGDLGGWIAKTAQLSQYDDCWLYDDATMHNNARMYDNAVMHHNTRMYNNAEMRNNARMYNNTEMRNNAVMYDKTEMYDNAQLIKSGVLFGRSQLRGDAIVSNTAINIVSPYYTVTIADNHIIIGCQSHTKEFWKNADYQTILNMDGETSAKNWMEFKDSILGLI